MNRVKTSFLNQARVSVSAALHSGLRPVTVAQAPRFHQSIAAGFSSLASNQAGLTQYGDVVSQSLTSSKLALGTSAAIAMPRMHFSSQARAWNNNNNSKSSHQEQESRQTKNNKNHREESREEFEEEPSVLFHAGVFAAMLALLGITASTAHACGIIAFTSKDEPCVDYLLEGLHILQNRGYDSAGVATVTKDGKIMVTKHASLASTSDSIELLKENAPARHKGDTCGIAHTRWATHGGKTDANAHPHTDYKRRIALVHNGTIENCNELKAELQKLGITFESQTDTEVIANLIGHHLDKGMNMMQAVKATLARLEGTWGLAIIHKDDPSQVIAARNGSPLVIGIGENRMFIASELSAFIRHTSQYISLNDGEVAVVRADSHSLDLSRVQRAHQETIELSPAPFKHWTLKEIYDQPDALTRTLGFGGRFTQEGLLKLGGLQRSAESLLPVNNLVISACGTSLFASLYGAKLMRNLKSFQTVQVEDAAETVVETFPPKEGGICVVSQSGETKDTHRALVLAQNLNLPAFSVVNQVGSLIARTTDCGVYLNAGREHAVASTKAFTTQVTALAMIAAWFSQARAALASPAVVNSSTSTSTSCSSSSSTSSSPSAASATASSNAVAAFDAHVTPDMFGPKHRELIAALHKLPFYTSLTLRTHDDMKKLAESLKSNEHMFILGKGLAEPIAKEAALKVKEITYIHAEGFSGGALKHGPFALLDKGTPVVMFILDDQHHELMKIAAQEVKARGTYNIVVTDKPQSISKDIADVVVPIPSNGPLTALLGIVPMQLLAYELAVAKGINPDKPKNLAKAVTVD